MGRTAMHAMAAVLALSAAAGAMAAAERPAPPSPREVLGFEVGQDRVLASYAEGERYLRVLADRSDRVRLLPIGTTVEGRTMLVAVVSSAENLARLDELRAGWTRIADPRGLEAAALARLVSTLPSCALITASIHATEVSGAQAALLFVHRLAAAPAGSAEAAWLDRTVVLVVPSMSPDGQDAVVAWYRRWLGTPYEGSNPPFLYHRYAGHDNNRDFVYLTQPESRALNRLAYRDWHPQLFLDLHQMGTSGPRQFVPPFADPLAPNVNPLVWRVTSHLGTLMALRLEEQGRAGVVSAWTFDGNWMGGTRNTGWWKNVFGVLTETASAALATPVEVDANELRGGGKGLVDYRAQVSFPNPWRGGRWGLADAVGYQLGVMGAFVEFAAVERESLLRDVAAMAAHAVAQGEAMAPRAYLVPPGGADPGRRRRLVELLTEAGVAGFEAPDGVATDGVAYPAGTAVFPAAQPLRQYLVEVMERQCYPEIEPAPDAEILLPYDVTAWTIPLALGVPAVRVEREMSGRLVPLDPAAPPSAAQPSGRGGVMVVRADQLGAFAVANRGLAAGAAVGRTTAAARVGRVSFPAGSFVVKLAAPAASEKLLAGVDVEAALAGDPPAEVRPLRRVAVGVYHPNLGLEDAGWLRFVLERAEFAVEVVDSAAVASGSFAGRDGVLVFPPLDAKTIVEGPQQRGPAPLPPEFRRGIGKDGIEAVKRFFAAGGTVIGFAGSADWLADALELPVSDPLHGAKREEFYCPGAMLALDVDPASPIGWGVAPRLAVMMDADAAFTTRPVIGEWQREVVARFPDEELLLSGWLRGETRLRRHAAVVEVRKGPGRAVLFAFAPYFRGQTEAAFPLLFNAVGAAMMDPPPAPTGAPKPRKAE